MSFFEKLSNAKSPVVITPLEISYILILLKVVNNHACIDE